MSMIALGLRLTVSSGREAAIRLAVTAVAVALGTGLLLVALAGITLPLLERITGPETARND